MALSSFVTQGIAGGLRDRNRLKQKRLSSMGKLQKIVSAGVGSAVPIKPAVPKPTVAQRVARTPTRVPPTALAPVKGKKPSKNFDFFLKKAGEQVGSSYDVATAGLNAQRPDIASRYAGLSRDIGLQETQAQSDINKQKVTDIGAIQSRAAKAGVFRSSTETGQELQYSGEVADRLAKLAEASNVERRKLGEGQRGEESDLSSAIAQLGINKGTATRELALERFNTFTTRRDKKKSDKQQLKAEIYKSDAAGRESAADREVKQYISELPYGNMTENQKQTSKDKLGISQAGIEAANARQLLGFEATAKEGEKNRESRERLGTPGKGKSAAERMKQFQAYLKGVSGTSKSSISRSINSLDEGTTTTRTTSGTPGKYGKYNVPEWKIGQVAKKFGVNPSDLGIDTSPNATISRWIKEGKSKGWINAKAKANKWKERAR